MKTSLGMNLQSPFYFSLFLPTFLVSHNICLELKSRLLVFCVVELFLNGEKHAFLGGEQFWKENNFYFTSSFLQMEDYILKKIRKGNNLKPDNIDSYWHSRTLCKLVKLHSANSEQNTRLVTQRKIHDAGRSPQALLNQLYTMRNLILSRQGWFLYI